MTYSSVIRQDKTNVETLWLTWKFFAAFSLADFLA